jgi:hypothetical protein
MKCRKGSSEPKKEIKGGGGGYSAFTININSMMVVYETNPNISKFINRPSVVSGYCHTSNNRSRLLHKECQTKQYTNLKFKVLAKRKRIVAEILPKDL